MKKRETNQSSLRAELMNLAGSDPTLAHMLKTNRPLNQETWLTMEYPDKEIQDLSPEELAAVPEPLQEAVKPKQKLPDAPKREQFRTQEEYEEALGGYRWRVGRLKALGGKKTEA